ncbi:mechanosensitive ion channel family protein [Massilibacteroides vaginae]|uniref:mechanosensitive ion channel family protein n=1 Tax=Massilibacteroides vaginae TaxID=1673718 RepID=UPI000A1CE92E|nr:mechanosensitive ion channel family protein [Massilibacteroides vaginae]
MSRFMQLVLLLTFLIAVPINVDAQLIEKAGEIIQSTLGSGSTLDQVDSVQLTSSSDSIHKQDSLRLVEIELQLQEMKLNEILLLSSLEEARNQSQLEDSLKMAIKRNRIDSLRASTSGVSVVVGKDTLFSIYVKRGGLTPLERANNVERVITEIGKNYSLKMDSLYVLESEHFSDIMSGEKVVFSVTEQDALWQNKTHAELAQDYIPILTDVIVDLRKEHNVLQVLKRVALFLLVLIAQYFLFRLTNFLFRKLKRKVIWLKQNKLKPITLRDYEFLNTHRQSLILLFCTNLVRYFVILLQLMISIPIIFSIFPQTESLALRLFGYLLSPIKMVFRSVVEYIPNLFIIIVIYLCIRYIVKGIFYVSKEIETKKLKIGGFYPDWAMPTYNIIRFLLYAFMIAMIYPYLPGADDGVFQGISVFVGLILSLGSTAIIGNIIAGLVITYMRPFKIGDRIKLNETTGNVIEKTPLVTRIRTPKNEVVTIPNSFIMSSHTTNYSSSARNYGLIIHTTVSFGYDVNWRHVHDLLIKAALRTNGVHARPKPFVLDTELQDDYPCYQINAYIRDVDRIAVIYSDLNQNIKDVCNEAGIELLSPRFVANRDGNDLLIPAEFKQPKTEETTSEE